MWIATGRHSTKVTNIAKNSGVSIGVPAEGDRNGDAVAIGTATLHDGAPTDVLEMFDANISGTRGWVQTPMLAN